MSLKHVGMITFDWYHFDPRVRRLAEAAADAGYSVDVICLRHLHEKRYEVCHGVHIYRVPMDRGFGRSLAFTILDWCWFLLLASVTITWLHLKNSYKVVLVHNMPDFLIFSALFPKLLGARAVLDIEDACPELMAVKVKGRIRDFVVRLATWQERISTAFADHIVTVGWTLEDLLVQRGVPQRKLTSILNSADPKFFPVSQRYSCSFGPFGETRPFILMYHGTVAERQGLATAIRALALASEVVPHVRLNIKGRGEHFPILKQLTIELGVSDKVVFSEVWCPYDEVVDFIAHGDVGIIPYQRDGFMELVLPTKAFEFAWMCRPMIASNLPGTRSMFRPDSIMLCEPSNPESFAAAIIDLYQHPEKCAHMVINAAEDYMPYRWEIMAKRYQMLLAVLSHEQVKKQLL